jgi:O-antigen ligase
VSRAPGTFRRLRSGPSQRRVQRVSQAIKYGSSTADEATHPVLTRSIPTRDLRAALPAVVVALATWLVFSRDLTLVKNRTYLFAAAVLVVTAPALVVIAAVPASFALGRVSAGRIEMSFADVALTGAAVAAIRFVQPIYPRMRILLLGVVAFQAILALVVIATPTPPAVFEWVHRIVLVAGAISVGVALERTGSTVWALRTFLATAVVFALDATRVAVTGGFQPAYPFGLQKNSAGLLFALGLLVLLIGPRLAAVGRARAPVAVALLFGLMATRSRGAIVALLIVGVIWAVRSGRVTRAAPLYLAAALALVAVVYVTTESEIERVRENPNLERFQGVGSRVATNQRAMEIWREDPVFGAGIRYFRDPSFGIIEPHNLVLHTLTEGGIVGLVAHGVLFSAAFVSLRRLAFDAAKLALYAIALRVVAALFDIFWVAGSGPLPWIFVGIALARSHHD